MTGKELGDKRGRPRRYDFQAEDGYSDPFAAYAVSALQELLARVIDQIEDLPPEAFGYTAPSSWFCLSWLPLHLAASEHSQMLRLARGLGLALPQLEPQTLSALEYGALEADGTVPAGLNHAPLLIEAMQAVRRTVTAPLCRQIPDAQRQLKDAGKLSTPQSVLMHQFWHWTYHSGHIGLMRLEWGSDYHWVMAEAPQS